MYQPLNYKYEGSQYNISVSLITHHFRNGDLCYGYLGNVLYPINLYVSEWEIHFIYFLVSSMLSEQNLAHKVNIKYLLIK